MERLGLELTDLDDIRFIHAVRPIIAGAVAIVAPSEVYIVKVDNWFGARWLWFSHKALGAVGIGWFELRIPPFTPARILCESYFKRVDGEYQREPAPLQLHVTQTSADNATRRVSTLCPDAALFWWSGNTLRNGRGSLMAHMLAPEGHVGWYAEFKVDDAGAWLPALTRRTSRTELEDYALHASAGQRANESGRPPQLPPGTW
jgi:hypothetical protein